MNKKLFKILMICFGVGSLVILITFTIIAIILKQAWWFGVPGIIVGSSWALFGFIFLIKKLSKPAEEIPKIDPKDAISNVIELIKNDINFSDNLVIKKTQIQRRGQPGKKTPILIVMGIGTELNNRIFCLVNLSNPKKEIMPSINPDVEEFAESIRLFAEEPENEMIKEQTITTLNHGFPTFQTTKTMPSSQKERDELDKKNAEEKTNL